MPNLYVTEPGARISVEHGRILVTKSDQVLADVPQNGVSEVVLVGRVGVTTPALHTLLRHEIGLALLSSTGEFLGRLSPDRPSVTSRVRLQYQRAEDMSFRLDVSRAVVLGKLWNCRVRCLRVATASNNQIARTSAGRIAVQIDRLAKARTLAEVRAVEGNGARAYFAAIRSHLNPAWEFPARRRRPPPDPFNAVLGACYTLLTESVYSATVLAGLDPYCGYFHSERPGRPALVLDLMEEFRPLVADTVALNLVNRRMLTTASFRHGPSERPVILSRDGYRRLLVEYGRRLKDRITIPGIQRRTTFQRLLEYQARRLVAFIEGREDAYKAFRTR